MHDVNPPLVEPNDDFELGEGDEDSEESLISCYFLRGFEYKEIFVASTEEP